MLKFYDIDENYVKYLQSIDSQVPNIHYRTNNKFVCGVVLHIHGTKFYAPISHTIKQFRTSMLIYDNQIPISSIRFSFMLPAYDDVLFEKDFKQLAIVNQSYADIVAAEYDYCLRHADDIYRKAQSVYAIGCNKNHVLNYTCCDFLKLEQEYLKYKDL